MIRPEDDVELTTIAGYSCLCARPQPETGRAGAIDVNDAAGPSSARSTSSPTILFLHGWGERGSAWVGPADSKWQALMAQPIPAYRWWPYLEQNADLRSRYDLDSWAADASRAHELYGQFLLIAPQASTDDQALWANDVEPLLRLTDELLRRPDVDKDRLYLAGLSFGAIGALHLAAASSKYAAVVAVVPHPEPALGPQELDALCKVSNRLWLAYGKGDTARSQFAKDTARKCGLHARSYDGDHVAAARRAFADGELIDWLLGRRLVDQAVARPPEVGTATTSSPKAKAVRTDTSPASEQTPTGSPMTTSETTTAASSAGDASRSEQPSPSSPSTAGSSSRTSPGARSATSTQTTICKGPLALPVDEYLYFNTFIPWKLARGDTTLAVPLKLPIARVGSLVAHYHDPDSRARKAPDPASVQPTLGKKALRQRFVEVLSAIVKPRVVPLSTGSSDPAALAKARGRDDALRRVTVEFRNANAFLREGFEKDRATLDKVAAAIKGSKGSSFLSQPLGFMFFERIRLRSVGHTLERAPFFELTITPGEVATLRHRSFSRRATTLEESAEETTERRDEFSSTFSTEFSREFERVIERTTNWGIQQSMSASVQLELVELKGQTDGSYSRTDQARTTSHELSRVIEQVARRVESTQKVSHKTVMTVAAETSVEEESIRVLRNDGPLPVTYLFRKLMRVLQGSHERFGVRACWSVPVEDPSRDLRSLLITRDRFPDEWAKAEEKWSNAPVPPDVAVMPADLVWYKGGGILDGGILGGSDDDMHSYDVPAGYELYRIETIVSGPGWARVFDGAWRCPHGATYPYPGVGATGSIYFYVHWGASATDVGSYDLRITCRPLASIRQEVEGRIQAWREKQIEAEVYRLLLPRYEEIMAGIPKTWPPMILMRRIMTDYFGLPSSFELVDMIHRLFDWDLMSILYYPPAYDPVREPRASQFVPTDFLTAPWAKVIIPLRAGNETDALSLLLSSGLIPPASSILEQIEYFLAQMTNVLVPLYTPKVPTDSAAELAEIRSPKDIDLTPLGGAAWTNEVLESPDGYEVVSRYLVTLPTDGVDIEEATPLCGLVNDYAKHRQEVLEHQSSLIESIGKQLDSGTAQVRVRVPTGDIK